LDYDEVRRVHRLEKNSSQLTELEINFFEALKELMKKERDQFLHGLKNGSITKARDYHNLEQVVRETIAIREKKILNRALISSRTNEASYSGLLETEQQLFKELLSILKSHKTEMNVLFGENNKQTKTKEKALKALSLQILSDVPSFIGTDLKEYGPFVKDQAVELPKKTADLLVERKLAIQK